MTLLTVLLGLALVAQPAPAPRVPTWRQSDLLEGSPTHMALFILAVCVMRERRAAAEAVLRTEPGTESERQAINEMLVQPYDPCLQRVTRLRGNSRYFRGAIAEAFYNQAQTRPLGDAPLPDAPTGTPATTDSRQIAACAVARRPLLAHQVVAVPAASPRELRALQALNPTFESCLPDGRSMATPRLYMRLLLAEALLRSSRAHPARFASRPPERRR